MRRQSFGATLVLSRFIGCVTLMRATCASSGTNATRSSPESAGARPLPSSSEAMVPPVAMTKIRGRLSACASRLSARTAACMPSAPLPCVVAIVCTRLRRRAYVAPVAPHPLEAGGGCPLRALQSFLLAARLPQRAARYCAIERRYSHLASRPAVTWAISSSVSARKRP